MVETQKKVEELKKTYLSWSLHDSDVRREGIAIGEERAKLEAARNLINLGVSFDIIAKAQDLSLETVQQLAEQLKAVPVQTN